MPEQPDPKIKELEDRLDALVRTQIDFQKEITAIRRELIRLNATRIMSEPGRTTLGLYKPEERAPVTPRPAVVPPSPTQTPSVQPPQGPANVPPSPPVTPPVQPSQQPPIAQATSSGQQPPRANRPPVREPAQSPGYELPKRTPYVSEPVLSTATTTSDPFSRFISQNADKARENLEEFVGKNLISLIGIVVLILGVGIGAKYAIDNNLISPLTRIIIGYVFAFGLVGLAIKLRKNYLNFSAVLFSGGMAIMYFVTYFAYSAYALIGQLPAFGLMIMFTVFTVTAAYVYSRQVIAHIGLVGAYAVPFLLSTDSGNYLALFIYMAVINTGVLAVALRKRWTPIFYTSSLFTWAIFCGWFLTKYSAQTHFQLALIFLAVFFAILYGTKIAQAKLLPEDADRTENLVSSMLTVAVFYAMCFGLVTRSPLDPIQYWTFFTYLAVASLAVIAASLKFFKHAFVVLAPPFFALGIFCGWFATAYAYEQYFELALVFLGVFFVIAYATTLVQARLLKTADERGLNLGGSVLATIVFYGFCVVILTDAASSPRYWTLFTYVAAASTVILATSFKFFGRVFMYVAVPLTWAIYGAWFFTRYDANQHFDLAAVFAALFFAVFYFSVLFHRLVEDNFSLVEHTSLVLSNAFVFYGFGYLILDGKEALRDYLGLYTAANAVLHLVVALAVRAIASKAVDVVQVLAVLVLTFASLAVPVQFEGNPVTMIWAVEAAVLFWFGRSRGVKVFERYSYPVMLLATGRLGLEWIMAYANRNAVTPFVNSDFITAAVFVAAFGFIYLTNRNSRYEAAINKEFLRPFGVAIALVGCIVLYNMFRMEIGNYFYGTSVNLRGGSLPGAVGDLQVFNLAWQINYTLFFFTAMAVINLKKVRSVTLAFSNGILGVFTIAMFATVSMFLFHELRTTFVSGSFDPDYLSHWLYIAIRPISYALAGALLYLLYEYTRDPLLEERVEKNVLAYGFETLAYTLAFIVASCELTNLMAQFGIPDGTKLGLSILWGVYALMMIVIGIARDKKHLRIAAFVLLAVTLAKLFFYDIAELDTISKTILFVTLGITLLVVSFLYNKYKGVMFKSDAVQED